MIEEQSTILVIDDDAEIRYSLDRVLRSSGHRVLSADSGEKGIETAKAESPAVIFLDNRMGSISGIETLQHLRTAAPQSMVILMTAYGTTQTAIEAMKHGAFELMPLLLIFLNLGISLPAKAVPDPEADVARFKAVYPRLDPGGVLYAYVSVDGDLAALGEWVEKIIGQIREDNPQQIPFPVDVAKLLQISGMDKVSAVGFSSKATETGFRNKSFFYTPKGRAGLLRVFGGEPKPFEVADLAPAGTEIAFQQELNLKVVYEVVLEAAGTIMGDPGTAIVEAAVKQPIPNVTFTMERVIRDLDTKVSVVIDADQKKKLKVPDEEFEIPYLSGAVMVDGLGWMADSLALLAEDEDDSEPVEEANWVGIRATEDFPGDFSIYKPVVLHHRPSGKLVVATHKDFAEALFAPKPNLREDPTFRKVMAGLPEKGNAMAYAAPGIFRMLREAFAQAIETAPGPSEAAIASSVLDLFLPPNARGEGSVTTNLPDGILTISNSSHSHKSNLLSAGLTGPMALGMASIMPMMAFGQAFDEEDFILEDAIEIEDIDEALDVPVGRGRVPRKPDEKFDKEGD